MKNEKQIAAAAAAFAERWQGRGYERGESQLFWADLLTNVYGVADLPSFIRYEEQVSSMVDSTNFIDGHIPSTKVLIEQKSLGKDLRAPIVQSDGGKLNPFQQAKKYVANMPLSQHPRWIVTCNFAEFLIYDMEQPNGEPEQVLLKDLGREYYRLQFLVDVKSEHLTKEMQVSMKAGEIVGKIYDALLKQYDDNSPEALRWLNILCVRIVFCLYAEDAGVFRHDQFHDFLNAYEAKDIRLGLQNLFGVLNTPLEKRSRYLPDDLKAFPYTNGGLFEEEIEIPQFTEGLKQTLLQNASLDFDWSEISPTIFGAVFESTLNPETRRSGGMHYTSIENIHKVIDPLFLNDLRRELDDILEEKVEKTRLRRLDEYQDKLASLTFLDPACGSGNFLTETYLSLRRLENEVIRERYHGQMMMGDFLNPIKVNIHQFYGIEINDFAVTVATTALWISEAQMIAETERIVQHDIDFLPLKGYANIKEGNALRVSWTEWESEERLPTIYAKRTIAYTDMEDRPATMAGEGSLYYDQLELHTEELVTRQQKKPTTYHVHFDYIMGNPPFVGARWMSKSQKQDVLDVFGTKWKNSGNLDYVCCWYKKASDILKANKRTKAAFVSTNSICQGEQVADLWQSLFEDGIKIGFAHRTFRWDSESSQKAHVYCVIVGFGQDDCQERECLLFDNNKVTKASHINGYLMDAPDVFIGSRPTPLCDVPCIGIGNKPIDGGNYLFTKEEMDEFIKTEPKAARYFKPWYGSEEFIHQRPRYCLWLGDCTPAELRSMPHCLKRVEAVRNMRLESKSAGTRKLADRPTRFHVENMPVTNFIIIPRVSSEKRRFIPIGFMSPDNLASDAVHLIPDATLYHFGVLTSNVHMAWVRAVCGRLKSDYRYSKDVVYNNFPWPHKAAKIVSSQNDTKDAKIVSSQSKGEVGNFTSLIESTAQAILDTRAKYPDCTLADLYDETFMPADLRRAHQANDRAVMQAYGFDPKMSESEIVAELFGMYKELITK